MNVQSWAPATPIKVVCPRLRGRFLHFAIACVALGMMIRLGNPNYQWSDLRSVPYGADFLQEWVAGDMLLSGAGSKIYDPEVFSAWQHDSARLGFVWPETDFYPAVYPPPYYCLVAPLAALPYWFTVPLWLAIMLAAHAATVWLIEQTSSQQSSGAEKTFPIGFWCATLLFPALFMGLVMGQKGTFWCFVAVVSWQLWRMGKPFCAGCLWALLSMKPTLCFLLPLVMLFNRQWRFSSGVMFGVVVLYGATAMVVPASLWSGFWEVMAGAADYQSQGGYRSGWSVSLWSLLRACECPRALALCLWSLAAVIMFASLLKLPGASTEHKLRHPDFLLRVFLSTALLSPHFYFYDLVWLLFPLRAMLNYEPRRVGIIMGALWLSVLAVQSSGHGWPLLSVTLLLILLHSCLSVTNCGTSFAIGFRTLARSQ